MHCAKVLHNEFKDTIILFIMTSIPPRSCIFTPDKISKLMSSFLSNNGNLLEPAVGNGQLLKFIEVKNYTSIDVYDINKEYLNDCPDYCNKNFVDFLTINIDTKYKNIILNPPYIRFQNLDYDYRNFIKSKWSILKGGNVDIYYAFILKCIELLDFNGIMISITPNSFLYNKSAYSLRKYLLSEGYIKEIIDFNSEKVFQGVSVYCCITIFTRVPNKILIYNGKCIHYNKIIDYNIFNTSDISITNTLPRIKTLGDVCSIKNGIATLRDRIYVHSEKLFDEPCWNVITNAIKDLWIIFPYSNGKILSEDYFRDTNPLTYLYLLSNKDELSKRDHGKKKYPEWYAFGRTQSLIKPLSKRVIYLPTMFNPCDFNKDFTQDSKLFISSLCIEVRHSEYSLNQIMNIINASREYIINNSCKRGSGWINLTSRVLKQILF